MKRCTLVPRSDWREKCESVGFNYHSMGGTYWDESGCYEFSAQEIDTLEAVTNELCEMSLAALEKVIQDGRFHEFAIPEEFTSYVTESWNHREPSLYGRFDLRWNGAQSPKLLEYNADTPTSLLEASVVQWQWLQDVYPKCDQFNSIHEKLIERWISMHSRLSGDSLHFTCAQDSEEDLGNLEYLRDTAIQAKYNAQQLFIEDIGWSEQERCFVDSNNERISAFFKLYPWEWLVREDFGKNLLAKSAKIIEPAWKMLLSNKALLVVLWEMFPNHPNLLPCYFSPDLLRGKHVEKPLLSREGENITIRDGKLTLDSQKGSYGKEGYVYQAFAPLPQFDGNYPVIGSWIIGDEAAGIGIREDTTLITKNSSRFIPHYFV